MVGSGERVPATSRAFGTRSFVAANARRQPADPPRLPAPVAVLSASPMTDDRITVAIGRIERAVDGIERAMAAPRPASAGIDPEVHAALEQRHARLRAEAEATLGALNEMIEARAARTSRADG